MCPTFPKVQIIWVVQAGDKGRVKPKPKLLQGLVGTPAHIIDIGKLECSLEMLVWHVALQLFYHQRTH